MREPQPHSQRRPLDENKTTRNACTRARKPRTDPQAPKCHSNETWQRHGIWYANMQKSVAKWEEKQPQNTAKWHPMLGMKPKCNIRHMKWLVNMIWTNTYMSEPQSHSHRIQTYKNDVPRNACARARKPRRWHTQCNMAKMAWKMKHGLILTWEGLRPTHIRARY